MPPPFKKPVSVRVKACQEDRSALQSPARFMFQTVPARALLTYKLEEMWMWWDVADALVMR